MALARDFCAHCLFQADFRYCRMPTLKPARRTILRNCGQITSPSFESRTFRLLSTPWEVSGRRKSEISSLSVDYKARKLNDTVVILVAVQTTAAQNADVNSQRAFQTSSGITGLAGDVNTKGVNSLFNANSNTTLKGSGATDSSSNFQTSMTAQVIAVLPSGNLVD